MRRQDTGWLWSYNNIKIHSKSEFVFLKLYCDYSNLLTLSNAGKLIRTISKSRKRKKKCYCIIAVMAVWGSEFYSLCYFLCVCVCVSVFQILKGSVFSRFGVSRVPEVFSHVRQGSFSHRSLFKTWPKLETVYEKPLPSRGGLSFLGLSFLDTHLRVKQHLTENKRQ